MADFIFRISPDIVLGSYTATRLGQYAAERGERYMLVIDPILDEVGAASKITGPLENDKIDFLVFNDVGEGAETRAIERALKIARDAKIHAVMAAGGTSAIDVGRAVAALCDESANIYDCIDGAKISAQPLPFVAVPTTPRAPFLFMPSIPVTDARDHRAKLLKCRTVLRSLALFDPNLSTSLTEHQSAAMTIEAETLAVEAHLSQRATFFSDMLAEKAAELLRKTRAEEDAQTSSTPIEIARAEGGCMASLAAASSAPGAATLLAMCAKARFGTNRSLVSAILLPYLIEDALKFKLDKVAKMSRLLGAAKPDSSDDEAAKALADEARQQIAKANVPARLKDLSISMEQLSQAAEDASALDLMNALPRSMTADDLFEIVKLAY